MLRYFSIFVLMLMLTACSTFRNAEFKNDRWGYPSALSLNGSGYYLNIAGADYFRSRTSLSENGWEKLPVFLNVIGYGSLKSLQSFGGDHLLQPDLCRLLYKKYNETASEKIDDASCNYNINPDDNNYEKYAQPLSFFLQQFNHYLVVWGGEEGLGGTIFFFKSYDLNTGKIASADINFLNSRASGDVFYKNDALHFYSGGCTPCDTRLKCPSIEMATLQLNTGIFSITKDATKYDCPSSEK